MLRLLAILILLPFVGFSQLKTDAQLTNDLNNLIPNNTSQLIKPLHVRTVIQNGYDSRVSMYGEAAILGKLTYASLFSFTDPKDIINKKYVDDAIAGFSGGVTSFNSRTGAITPLSTDYAAYYYPASGNPSGFLTTAPVTSAFSRTGVITAQSGDYNTSQVTENTNLYFTNARAQTAISATSPLTYTSGVLGLPAATASVGGHISTSAQIFGGRKQFNGGISVYGIYTNAGDVILSLGASGTPTNWLEIASDVEPNLTVQGGSTNADMKIQAKGTGKVKINSPIIAPYLAGTGTRIVEADLNGNLTAASKINKTLAVFTNAATNTNTNGTYTTLYSYTIPANTLSSDGDKLTFEVFGENTSLAVSSKFRFQLAGSWTGNVIETATAATSKWRMICVLTRLTATSSVMSIEGIANNAGIGSNIYNDIRMDVTTNFATSQTLTFQGDANMASHTARSGMVIINPAP